MGRVEDKRLFFLPLQSCQDAADDHDYFLLLPQIFTTINNQQLFVKVDDNEFAIFKQMHK